MSVLITTDSFQPGHDLMDGLQLDSGDEDRAVEFLRRPHSSGRITGRQTQIRPTVGSMMHHIPGGKPWTEISLAGIQ